MSVLQQIAEMNALASAYERAASAAGRAAAAIQDTANVRRGRGSDTPATGGDDTNQDGGESAGGDSGPNTPMVSTDALRSHLRGFTMAGQVVTQQIVQAAQTAAVHTAGTISDSANAAAKTIDKATQQLIEQLSKLTAKSENSPWAEGGIREMEILYQQYKDKNTRTEIKNDLMNRIMGIWQQIHSLVDPYFDLGQFEHLMDQLLAHGATFSDPNKPTKQSVKNPPPGGASISFGSGTSTGSLP